MWAISTLGGLSIERNGESVTETVTHEAAALLIYLGRVGHACTKKALAELLWGERTHRRAMSSLSGILAEIRTRLGGLITITGDAVALDPAADLWLDVDELEEKLSAGELEEAITLYKGPFLAGLSTGGEGALEQWIAQQRRQVHSAVLDALQALTAREMASCDLRAAIPHATHLLALDPQPEPAAWQAKLLAALHQAAGALAADTQRRMVQLEQDKAERERMLEAARAQAQRWSALLRLSAELGAPLDEVEICRSVVNGLHDSLGYERLALMLVDPATGDRVLTAGAGLEGPPGRLRPGEGLSERPLLDGRLHYTPDVTQEPRCLPAIGQACEVDVPVVIGREVLGVLIAGSRRPCAFDQDDLEVLTAAARQAAIAIHNTRLHHQAQRQIGERVRVEAELLRHQEHLEELIEERTADLRESEARYRSLFDGVPVGLYRTTLAGQIVDANLAQVQMLGYPSREALLAARSADLYVNPDERVRWQALMEQEGVVRDFQVQFRRHDGTLIWVNDSARALKDKHDQVQYYEGSLEDISARKQAEAKLEKYREALEELVQERTAELRASEERYRTLFDGVPVGLYRTTPEGRLVDVNRALVEMTRFQSRAQMVAADGTVSFYADPEERLRWQALMEREGIVRDFEFRHRRYDGTIMWVRDTARAVRDRQGKVLYYEGALEDVTERRELEEEVRRQKDYYEALFVNSPVAVVTADLAGRVVSWNPMAERLLGYKQDEAIGRELDDLVAHDARLRAEAQAYTDQVIQVGRVQATTRRTRKDASLVDVELLALPVVVAGEKVGFITIYVDITDLLDARRQAEAASEAKGTFLANMSHELRTPLNAILGFSQLLGRGPSLTSDQHQYLEIIGRSGEHLLSLINDVLEISKIEAGKVVLQQRPYDLYRQLDGLAEVFGLRAQEKGLELAVSYDEDVPQYIVGDERKLGQVLGNLLGNAVKFTEDGSVALRVTVQLSAQPSDPRQRNLHFEVEDTGPGIAPGDLPTIFDAFVQSETGRRAEGGTGLGLTISRQFVGLMGGELTASSEVGRGSCFSFDASVGVPQREETAHAAAARRRAVGLEKDQPALRLLVVDDSEVARLLLVKLLEPIGFEVKEAANGQEAIEVWRRWEPHVILMDMRMPVMDGYEATKRIKATRQGRDTLVVGVSASAFEEDRERILSIGCNDFLRKPFEQQQILDILSNRLKVRFVYEEVEPVPHLKPVERAPLRAADVELAHRLAGMPPEWLADLQKAVTLGEWTAITELVDRIRERDAELGRALAGLAHQFEHDRMLTLIRRAGGQP
jgi:PAS domain S-box-containing protein